MGRDHRNAHAGRRDLQVREPEDLTGLVADLEFLAGPAGVRHAISTYIKLPIRGVQIWQFAPQHPSQHEVVAVVEMAIVRHRIHIPVSIVHGRFAILAVPNEIRGSKP